MTRTIRAILLGGLAIAVLDGLDAAIFFGLRGVSPVRVFQAIAAGLLGPAAFRGGSSTFALGLALHVGIAITIAVVAYLLARRIPALAHHAYMWGPLYGIGVWVVMNFVVIPLSALQRGALTAPVVLNGLLIHVFGVGIPAMLAARAALAHRNTESPNRPTE